jgi:catechol 2,3-dioxygenase-like lactoylglutathione lyase family enzyme
MLPFWQNEVGLRFDHVLPLRRSQTQYRHDAAGSVVKINHHIEPIPSAPPSGYRELIVAQTSRSARLDMADPDGNAVSVVPPGYHGVKQIGIRMGVRDLDVHRHFYANVVGLREQAYPLGAAFRAGDTVLFLEQKPDVVVDAGMYGLGWRYITFQVFTGDEVHARMIAAGARERISAEDARNDSADLDGARSRRELDRVIAACIDCRHPHVNRIGRSRSTPTSARLFLMGFCPHQTKQLSLKQPDLRKGAAFLRVPLPTDHRVGASIERDQLR